MKFLWIPIFFLLLGCKGPILPPTNQSDNNTEMVTLNEQNQKRFVWQEPAKVISMLGDISNKDVADIGAGTGYFTFRLLFKANKVIAIDIDPNMLDIIEAFSTNLDHDVQQKLITRLAQPDDSKLVDNEVDVIIIINTIGYIDDREGYLAHLYPKLRDGGQIMIVDFKSKQLPFEAPVTQRVPLYQTENELTKAGFRLKSSDDTSLEYQYIIIAEK